MIHALHAELTKTLSLRSIQTTFLAALVVPPGLAWASGFAFAPNTPAAVSFPTESHGFETAGFGQPLVILLAALIAGGEYLDGQLRSTLLATPSRSRALGAKLVVTAVLAAAIGFIATTAAVLLKHAALGADGLRPSQFTIEMASNLLGVAINYTLIALIAAGITVIARTFVITLVVLVPLALGLTISMLGLFPFLKYLPDLAGIQLLTGYPGVGLLDPILGGIVMASWAAVLIAVAFTVFTRRDVGGA